ncbi:TPM domain-containing protein [Roseixanthobacter glucoisosaccharinicivorans]|uniref:TPM domain-containing protein n=1 Tax=Roseixanthobacter glucoisosaccharinicivorans TaxID=3119923 RepID=UPI003727EAC5
MSRGTTECPSSPTGRPLLTPEDLERIAEAVAQAEQVTRAEIRVAVASGRMVVHSFHGIMWAALAALIVPWGIIAVLPMRPVSLLALQAGCFIVLCVLLTWPPVAARLVPLAARRHAARAMALEVFRAHGLHQTEARSGLLIFVAPQDRLVELVADEGVQAAIPHEAWIKLCGAVVERAGAGALAEGITAAVAQAGTLLAPHLPAVPGDRNELSDRVVLI